MASVKNINTDYTLNVGPADGNGVWSGNGIFTVNAQTVFTGNVIYNVPSVSVSPFITVAANNTGVFTDMGLLGQTGANTFAGLRFDTIVNAWQTSNSVTSNGVPITAYANINTPPGGPNTAIQFNDNGVFGGNTNLTFDTSTNLMSLAGNLSVSGNVTAQNINANINITSASANIIYVAKNGSSSNTGGLTSPLLTIESAMNMAAGLGGNRSIHVAPGTYTENMPITIPPNTALMGDNLRNVNIIPQVASSDMFYMSGGTYVWGVTVKGYTGKAFSYDPTTVTTAFVSPYIQNITSSTTTGTAVYIDGDKCNGTKAMIVGFFTIINRNGYGIHLLNSAYSQLVNIYTIACDIGIQVESGAFCTLNGSDCSIGNYGLVADGVGPLQTSGNIVSQFQGSFVIDNLLSNNQPHVNTVVVIDGDPEFYTIDTILPNIPGVGNSTVLIQQTYLGNAAPGTGMSFYTRSSIIASAHTFEYVGAGTNPATALPQYGGIPIEANEVVATNGAVITYTSTDQKGNFKVGSGFIVNQATATITGDAFYKSLFAQMTPYILAISGD
jgi:hypothetical protein